MYRFIAVLLHEDKIVKKQLHRRPKVILEIWDKLGGGLTMV